MPVHLSSCKYRRTAKHIDDSYIRIYVIYNCRCVFVLFNEKHAYEFKKIRALVFAVIWYFGICIIR